MVLLGCFPTNHHPLSLSQGTNEFPAPGTFISEFYCKVQQSGKTSKKEKAQRRPLDGDLYRQLASESASENNKITEEISKRKDRVVTPPAKCVDYSVILTPARRYKG
jgi:hypothetical protein